MVDGSNVFSTEQEIIRSVTRLKSNARAYWTNVQYGQENDNPADHKGAFTHICYGVIEAYLL